jgi:hypothetical protein
VRAGADVARRAKGRQPAARRATGSQAASSHRSMLRRHTVSVTIGAFASTAPTPAWRAKRALEDVEKVVTAVTTLVVDGANLAVAPGHLARDGASAAMTARQRMFTSSS